jgi:antitoxin ParD1/3/4
LERYVQEQVESGRYASESEVVKEALKLLECQNNERAAQIRAFQDEVDRRLASLDRGEGVDGDEFFAQFLKRRADERHRRE